MDVPAPFEERITVQGDGHPVVGFRSGVPPGEGPVVVAAHGITANAVSWAFVAPELPDATFVALDLRGRGESGDHPGPYGMRRHAADCLAVLDACDAERGIVVGHSMGAYVAAMAAAEAPDRWVHAVLVDGGLAIPLPPGTDADTAIDEIVGPALTRLTMSWADRHELLAFWQRHPALTDWNRQLDDYVDHDVRTGPDGHLRSRVNERAVRFDGRELLVDEEVINAATNAATNAAINAAVPAMNAGAGAASVPLTVVRAARGLLGDLDNPLVPAAELERFRTRRPDATVVELPAHLNHYTAAMSADGAAVVAGAVRQAAAAI